ncbi:MAG: diacylglycerol kinase family lipid kinase [Caulobacteraceae bacterium]|nr:diacylglycerol kinase family lipid kinase [Caulobacter sp.]
MRRVRAVVNRASGGAGRDADVALERAFAEHGLEAQVAVVDPADVEHAVRAALDAAPDLLVLVAGDGTARFAGQACGPGGPLLAPLAGGTMNMLPHALYGPRPWRAMVGDLLETGEVRDVSGGEVDGRAFFVAAILGAPALWASAREALRAGKLRIAWLRAERAVRRAFSGRLRFALDGGERRRTEALTLMCPLVARSGVSGALEANALDPRGATEAFRLGARTLLPGGDWRADASVTTGACFEGRAWAHGRIPLVLDGEPHRLPPEVTFRFTPRAFRAYVPAAMRDTGSPTDATAAAAGAAADEVVRSAGR